jgi:predicted ArsR family transcriptional regulator
MVETSNLERIAQLQGDPDAMMSEVDKILAERAPAMDVGYIIEQALRAAARRGTGLTAAELAPLVGLDGRAVRGRLRQMVTDGKIMAQPIDLHSHTGGRRANLFTWIGT